MLGKQNGVEAQLLKLFLYIIIQNCLNHPLEMAVSDTRNEVPGVNHLHSFTDNLYPLYSILPNIKGN